MILSAFEGLGGGKKRESRGKLTRNSRSLKVINVHHRLFPSIPRRENHLQLSRSISNEIGRAVLVSESVSTDRDGFRPPGDGLGDRGHDDGFSEDGAVEDVSDRSVGRSPLECDKERKGKVDC